MPRKHPPLTEEEQARVRELAPTHTVEEIAAALKRQRLTVLNFVRRYGVVVRKANRPVEVAAATPEPTKTEAPPPRLGPAPQAPLRREVSSLRKSPIWRQLQRQFDAEELKYFEERYVELLEQFKEDVFASEEMQVHLLIKMELLINRNLEQQNQCVRQMDEATRRRQELADRVAKGLVEDEREAKREIKEAEVAFQDARAARSNAASELMKYQDKHADLLQALKATREQRVTRIESSKESFLSVIKRLQLEDERSREGQQMELMRRVTERERQRLASYHDFADGNRDQPLLNAETVS
jgi:hypothetical protein